MTSKVPGSPCRPPRPINCRSIRGEFVKFGQDDVEAALALDALAELDVGAAAGHVGGHGDAARQASLRPRSRPPRDRDAR